MFHRLALLLLTLSLVSCAPDEMPTTPMTPSAEPSFDPGYNNSLGELLTGSVVTGEEQQLRDILKRQIVLDFPIKVGILFHRLNSKLDRSDHDAAFKSIQQQLEASGLVSEVVEMPEALLGNGGASLENLRRLGSRFQTDVLVLVSGSHQFQQARDQNLSFFDSFSDARYFESQVQFQAIALDIFTGTLLSPFRASHKGQPERFEPSAGDFKAKTYAYQKTVENEVWQRFGAESLEHLKKLKSSVEASLREGRVETKPQPSPSPAAEPEAPVEEL